MMRALRTDANLTSIVTVLRKAGCSVHVTNGMWDLTVSVGNAVMLLEVKDPRKPPSQRRRTPAQTKWLQTWQSECRLILSPEDALEAVSTLRRWASKLKEQ